MDINILSKNLDENIELIEASTSNNTTFFKREIILENNIRATILFIAGLSDQDRIEDDIIAPLLFKVKEDLNTIPNLPDFLSKKYIKSFNVSIENSLDNISEELHKGNAIVLLENHSMGIICSTSGQIHRSIQSSDTEISILGGKDAFIENLDVNISLINQKLNDPNLKIEKFNLGTKSKTDVALIYIDGIMDTKILNKIRKNLKNIDAPYIGGTGYIAKYLFPNQRSIFPLSKMTEIPDTVVTDMLQGKATIMVNGFPHALIIPVVFIEFFQAFEDYVSNNIMGSFERLLRIISAFILITLSPLYVALLEYNVELIPLPLIKVLIKSRSGIPLSPFIEVLVMELLIEMLREGGIRLPKPIGQTLGIVGGIVLGDAATRAGIVSQTTLVVVAIGIICTFLVPNYNMSTSLRLLRFPMILLAKLLGFLGIIAGLLILVLNLICADSFSIPYLSPISPLDPEGIKDSIIMSSIKKVNRIHTIFTRFTRERSKNAKKNSD
ncbi:spore germination protein [Hathewaya histolytica]|uniref:spore germination protein n=1 Tax=Hathewaya histolytica TaxID=1498 RepID=UPI003B670475